MQFVIDQALARARECIDQAAQGTEQGDATRVKPDNRWIIGKVSFRRRCLPGSAPIDRATDGKRARVRGEGAFAIMRGYHEG